MLAQPKHRTVWTVNPRGNDWYNDTNKIGHKLLKNMGWKEGNGLGKHQNGIKEQIKLSSNSNNNGLGFKRSCGQELIADNDEYEQILRQLSQRYDTMSSFRDKSTKSINLEEKAKNFRNRVPYRSFIRAKNLCNYSENDIKSIFPQMPKIKNEEQLKCEELSDNQIISKMNLNQYFSLKMKKIKDGLNEKQAFADIKTESLSSTKCLNVDTNESINLNDDRLEKCVQITDNTNDLMTNQNIQLTKERIKRKKLSNKCDKSDAKTTNNYTPKKIKLKSHDCSENSIELNAIASNVDHEKNEFINIKNRYVVSLHYNANQSVNNYDKICDAISKHKCLNTTNLTSICGYGIDVKNCLQ